MTACTESLHSPRFLPCIFRRSIRVQARLGAPVDQASLQLVGELGELAALEGLGVAGVVVRKYMFSTEYFVAYAADGQKIDLLAGGQSALGADVDESHDQAENRWLCRSSVFPIHRLWSSRSAGLLS